jgi:hypothetical protein
MLPGSMEAPAIAECGSGGKGRRDPAKPVTQLIDSTNRPTHPAQPDPLKAIQKLLCAVGVGPARLCRSRGVSPR